MSLTAIQSLGIRGPGRVAVIASLSGLLFVLPATAQQRLFSHMTTPGSGFAPTILVVNTTGRDQQITVGWFDQNGRPLDPETFAAPGGATLVIDDIPTGTAGATIVSADLPLPVVVNTRGRSRGDTHHRTYNATAQSPDDRPEASIFFPIRQGGGASTSYTVASVGTSSCAETLLYVSGDGVVHPAQMLQLGPGKSRTVSHNTLFPGTAAAPDPGGTVAANGCAWVGSATVTNASGHPSVSAPVTGDDLSQQIALPYIPASDEANSSHVLLNPNGSPSAVTIDYYDLSGRHLASLNTTVGRDKTLEGLLDRAFGKPASAVLSTGNRMLGRTEITVTAGARGASEFYTAVPAVGIEEAITKNGVAFGAEPAEESAVQVRAVNLGTNRSKILVTVYSASGRRLLRKKVKLKAHGTGTLPYPDKATGPGVYARIKVLNGGPVAAGLLQTWDSGELLYYPAWTLNNDGSLAQRD